MPGHIDEATVIGPIANSFQKSPGLSPALVALGVDVPGDGGNGDSFSLCLRNAAEAGLDFSRRYPLIRQDCPTGACGGQPESSFDGLHN
ncbi:hypothetical protein HPB50_018367 [Hyalomma asiaticum]|uniref:Uncharacterized protein n=1 Tax=Hyalomma asiaticum TaxID=266040 RepID=A0ACB7TME1_HYAAI|nr:hypothetical protein HPB50_018367 [Hyalomma asiaticum]